MQRHRRIILLDELVELVRITDVQLGKGEDPLVNVDRMLVADGRAFQEIVGVLLGLGLGDVLLDVLVEAHGLVVVDGLQVVEVDVLEDLLQLFLLLLA